MCKVYGIIATIWELGNDVIAAGDMVESYVRVRQIEPGKRRRHSYLWE